MDTVQQNAILFHTVMTYEQECFIHVSLWITAKWLSLPDQDNFPQNDHNFKFSLHWLFFCLCVFELDYTPLFCNLNDR